MKPLNGLGRAYWMCAAFTGFSSVVSAGFSLLSLRMAVGREHALYAASRSVALPLAVLYAIVFRSRVGVGTLALAMTLVQVFDAAIGCSFMIPVVPTALPYSLA